MRPLLLPHVRRLWRDGNTLQLGTDPRVATVLELDNPATVRVLDLLDGTRTERGVITEAAGFGVTAREAEAMIDALRGHGLLVTARSLLPVGLTDQQRERMAREAGALALAGLAERAAAQTARSTPDIATPGRDTPAADAARTDAARADAARTDAARADDTQTDDAARADDTRIHDTPAHPTPDPATPAAATPAAATPGTGTPVTTAPRDRPADTAERTGRVPRRAAATPADMLRRRASARVLVAGHAWLGALIAAGLGAAGIGGIDPALDGWTRIDDAMLGGLLPADAHRSRASAAADAVRRVAPEAVVTPLRQGSATFVVRVGSRPGSALATRGVRQRTAARLDVYLRDAMVVVGPLVVPGRSPCGQCLELHRRDRDSAWPALAAQLATGRDTTEACAVTTALAGAAYAVEEVLRHTDGRPVRTLGAAVEIADPGTARRRSWPAHPRCDCSRRRRSPRSGRQPRGPSNNGS